MPYYDTNYNNYDPIEQEIVKALEKFVPVAVATPLDENLDWTLGIKAVFGAIAYKGQRYKICATIEKDNNKHIPFDQIRTAVSKGLNLYVPTREESRKEFDSEWLYDIVWYQDDPINHYLLDVPLVAESELSPKLNELIYDFQKLLVSRSKHRIMIYEYEFNNENIADKLDALIDQIKNSKLTQPGDRYLFCVWEHRRPVESQKFRFKLFVAP